MTKRPPKKNPQLQVVEPEGSENGPRPTPISRPAWRRIVRHYIREYGRTVH